MDYKIELEKIKNEFENSFNFYVLKNNYGFSGVAKEFLDEYKSIKNNMWYDDVNKYKKLKEHLDKINDVTLLVMQDIKKINSLWEPDFESLKGNATFYEADLSKRCKAVCDSLKELFENASIRKQLTNANLYNLYVSYYQISNAARNRTLTNDMLIEIENKFKNITDMVWNNSITNPKNYVPGEPFMFIVHNFSKTIVTNSTKINEQSGRNGRISTSLITDKEMGVFGNNKYGFVYSDISKIVTAGKRDLYSYETEKEGKFMQNSDNSSLITPQEIEAYCVNKCVEENGQTLSSDSSNIYNEILLNSEGLSPSAVYCITFGEKDLSDDYRNAKALAENVGLPLIEIDISLYRTKNNQGTYLTDRDPLTPKEQSIFVESFLKQYYSNRGINLELSQRLIESDINLYKDIIIDLFLEAKRNDIDINKDSLFDEFTKRKENQKNKADKFNEYIGESKQIIKAVKNLNEALTTCSDEDIRKQIEQELSQLVSRLKSLNKLAENSSDLGLSNENSIYQSNKLSDEIMGTFSPYITESITIGDEKIDVILGYKLAEEIEKEKNKMFESLKDKTNVDERINHAKKVIETKCDGYKANSLQSHIQLYERKREDLDMVVDKSQNYLDIATLDKKTSEQEQLFQTEQQLNVELSNIQENLDLLRYVDTIKHVEELKKKSETKIASLNGEIKRCEENIRDLNSTKTDLQYEKSKLEKGFMAKIINSEKINELERRIQEIEFQVEKLERTIDISKTSIQSEREIVSSMMENNSTLKDLKEKGLTLESALEKISNIEPNSDQLFHQQTILESKLSVVENQLKNVNADYQKHQEDKKVLEEKKQQVGIQSENKNIVQNEQVDEIEETIKSM